MRGFDIEWLIRHVQLLEIAERRQLTPEEIRSAYREAQFANFTIVDLNRPLTAQERQEYRVRNGPRIREAVR